MRQDFPTSLVLLSEAAAWSQSPERVYQNIVDASVEVFDCCEAHLHLLDFEGSSFIRYAFHSLIDPSRFSNKSVTSSRGRMNSLWKNGDLIIMDYRHPHPDDELPPSIFEEGFVTGLSIPLTAPTAGILGMLSLTSKNEMCFDEEHRRFYLDCGRVLGVQLERMSMSRKNMELRILQERKQLSNELHDNVAQLISALAIYADTALTCYDEGDEEGMCRELVRLGGMARETTKVMREEMLSLRAPCADTEDFSATVSEILEGFSERWGIATNLEVTSANQQVTLSAYSALQLTRILNEALSNVFKHSHATRVEVCMFESSDNLVLIIDDDGRGFDTEAVSKDHLGIRIMNERAAAAGGKVFIESGGNGTTVCASIPRDYR